MKFTHFYSLKYLVLIVCVGCWSGLAAQNSGCVFKDTLFRVDFGSDRQAQEFNLRSLGNYQRAYSNCPNDGFYSYSSQTRDCFFGDWIMLTEDHTPNDIDGKMFFVNASERASTFFIANLSGFKGNTTYEFGVYMMNLCRVNGGCVPLPPNIFISLELPSGQRLTAFTTGKILSSFTPSWKKYYALFTVPPGVASLVLKMENNTNGGCGNDFTMDDITFRECYKPEPLIAPREVVPAPRPEMNPPPVVSKKVVKEPVIEINPLKKERLVVTKKPVADTLKSEKEITRVKAVNMALPDVILKRANPVVKQIRSEPAQMQVELYDNGQIDGDTVSIYHNNELIVSKAGLSEKPIRFTIGLTKNDPHHELIMVADNLGSIPPNTSLMIITANGKRYEIFISSSEQKNARLLIDLIE